MYIDKFLQFDPNPTLITVTAVSTNVLDMLAQRDMAIGDAYEAPAAVVTVIAALVAAGAATLTVQIQGSVDNVTWTTFAQTDAIPKANLTVGTQIELKLPKKDAAPHAAGIPRFYRLNYVVATGPFTGGSVEADLIPVVQQDNNPPSYASGFVVNN